MDFESILKKCINDKIQDEAAPQYGPLSSSNALLFNGVDFEAEGSDHCPRIALLRRVANIQEDRSSASYLSNTHGRLFEEQLKTLLQQNNKLEWVAEEEAAVSIEDSYGNILITSRPDLVMKYNNEVYVVENKTIQSNSTAYSVIIKGKPKLNAAIQVTLNLYGHSAEKGFILYAANNWFGGFAGKTQWKVTPTLKIFSCRLTNGTLYYNDIKSAVTVDKLLSGSVEFLKCKSENRLPARPQWIDINGDIATYSGCTYCPFKGKCDDYEGGTNLNEFFDHCTITGSL